MKWRFDIINFLLARCSGKRYLEVGVEDGDSLNKINCTKKHGCDPASKNATHHVPSDEFFEMLAKDYKYNVVFVDGLHVADQAHRDIVNSLEHLEDGGFIVVHDCNPPSKWHQRSFAEAQKNGCRLWNGDVYKAIVQVRAERDDIDVCVVDTDWGCAVIRKVKPAATNRLDCEKKTIEEIDYEWFDADRKRLLNLISVDDFRTAWIDGKPISPSVEEQAEPAQKE